MNQYEELKSLGRGAYAVVRLVKRKADNEKFVVKRFYTPMSDLTPKERTEVAQEVCASQRCCRSPPPVSRAPTPAVLSCFNLPGEAVGPLDAREHRQVRG